MLFRSHRDIFNHSLESFAEKFASSFNFWDNLKTAGVTLFGDEGESFSKRIAAMAEGRI